MLFLIPSDTDCSADEYQLMVHPSAETVMFIMNSWLEWREDATGQYFGSLALRTAQCLLKWLQLTRFVYE